MKRLPSFLFLLLLLALATACGSKPVPDWKMGGFNALESYKKNFLEGDERKADLYFELAVREIQKSGDPDLLDRALLTRCALRTAALETLSPGDCVLAGWKHTKENESYLVFLREGAGGTDPSLLPQAYRNFAKALEAGKTGPINDAVAGIDDPLSRIIASAVAVKGGRFDDRTLELALEAASREGWKKIVLLYLGRLEDFSRERGDAEQADRFRRRQEILSTPLK
jgi:hypothetical protein